MSRRKPKIVIIGGGFGGLEAAKRLKRTPADVTLIDRNNFHLFQPLLYQVATGGLSPANIATPLRMILRRHRNCDVIMASVEDFDLSAGQIRLDREPGIVEFDYLVVAAGATHSYFGNDQWESRAPGLKTIPEATEIRRRIYRAFEHAEVTQASDLRNSLMNFVVVGGGPTGVEMAGAMAEISRNTLRDDFRHIRPEDARIHLVEAGPQILAHYPEKLQQRAAEQIRKLGVHLHLNNRVTDITDDCVSLDGPDGPWQINTETVVWAAGVQASPLGRKLCDSAGVEATRGGQVPVNPNCSVGAFENVFVIGDLASAKDESGHPLPGVAPVAIQQGKYVARLLGKAIESSGKPGDSSAAEVIREARAFRYRDLGSMATIGRAAAVAQMGRLKFSGFLAWMAWLLVHLMQIVRFQNRLLILTQWAWNYITFNRSARIIVDPDPEISNVEIPVKRESADMAGSGTG